jgi:hypothetical protein
MYRTAAKLYQPLPPYLWWGAQYYLPPGPKQTLWKRYSAAVVGKNATNEMNCGAKIAAAVKTSAIKKTK